MPKFRKNLLGPVPIHYIVIQYPQQMVQMAFCDLLYTFHKQVTNVSQHVLVILLWRMLMSLLTGLLQPLLLIPWAKVLVGAVRSGKLMSTWY